MAIYVSEGRGERMDASARRSSKKESPSDDNRVDTADGQPNVDVILFRMGGLRVGKKIVTNKNIGGREDEAF